MNICTFCDGYKRCMIYYGHSICRHCYEANYDIILKWKEDNKK